MNRKNIFIVLLLLVIYASTKMLYVVELFRHGARYPVFDIYDGKETKALHGNLTSVGLRQHYILGSYLGKDYKQELGLSDNFNGRQVEVYADKKTQRCMMSALAHMSGWFPLGTGPTIPDGIDDSFLEPPFDLSDHMRFAENKEQFATTEGYQSIPIKISEEYWPHCPRLQQLVAERVAQVASKIAILQEEEQIFIDKIRKTFKLPLIQANIPAMIQLYDTVMCDLNLGRKVPAQFTDKELSELRYIENYMLVLLYDGRFGHIFSTPFLKGILENMNKVIKGEYGQKKLTVLSGHDTNVAPVLTTLNLTSAECLREQHKNQTFHGNCAEPVPFAGNIQFQFHSRYSTLSNVQLDNYFVKVRYNGEYYRLCSAASYQCDFEQFSERISRHLVDFHSACKLI